MTVATADTANHLEDSAGSGTAERNAILRFAFGLTLAVGLSQVIAWPVGFLAAVFLAMLLQAPRPLSFVDAVAFLMIMSGALTVGMILGAFLPYMPFVSVLLLILLFCATFYWSQTGVPQLHVVLIIVGLTLMPVLAVQSPEIAFQLAGGILTSGMVAVLLTWLMFGLLPAAGTAADAVEAPPVEPPGERFAGALVMTAIIAPLVVAFLFFGWTQLIVLIIPAFLVQQLSLSAGIKGGLALVAANLAGGVVAVSIYYLLVATPHLIMLIALILLVSLLFARRIFSGQPDAALWGSAYTAIIIIVCGAVAPFGDNAEAKLFDRIGQLVLAVAYVGTAFALWQGLRFGRATGKQPDAFIVE